MPRKKKPTSRTFLLIFILAVLAVTLVTWKVVIAPRRKATTSTFTPTPTRTVESKFFTSPEPAAEGEGQGDSPQDLVRSLEEKFPLVRSVPYETTSFKIDYRAPLKLEVRIKVATDEAKIKEEISAWMWSKGVNPSTHEIDYVNP